MVQFVMELELSEQSVSPTRLFASSCELRMASNIAQGHLRRTQCSAAKSDADLPQTIILKVNPIISASHKVVVVGSIYNPFSYMVLVRLVDFHFKRNYQACQKKWLSVQGLGQGGKCFALSPPSSRPFQ